MKSFTVKELVSRLTSEFGTPAALPHNGLHFVVSGNYGIAVYPKQSRVMATFTAPDTGVTKQLADVPAEGSKFGKVDYFKKLDMNANLEDWSNKIITELKAV